MNEQFQKLYEQSFVTDPYVNVGPDGTKLGIKFDPEKFAELIVRECVGLLREESERLYRLSVEEKDELFASNFEICAEKCVDNEVAIKEHFGVTE